MLLSVDESYTIYDMGERRSVFFLPREVSDYHGVTILWGEVSRHAPHTYRGFIDVPDRGAVLVVPMNTNLVEMRNVDIVAVGRMVEALNGAPLQLCNEAGDKVLILSWPPKSLLFKDHGMGKDAQFTQAHRVIDLWDEWRTSGVKPPIFDLVKNLDRQGN